VSPLFVSWCGDRSAHDYVWVYGTPSSRLPCTALHGAQRTCCVRACRRRSGPVPPQRPAIARCLCAQWAEDTAPCALPVGRQGLIRTIFHGLVSRAARGATYLQTAWP
jgi:hypothetical protein